MYEFAAPHERLLSFLTPLSAFLVMVTSARIIGVDPGLAATGVGVIEAGESARYLHHAVIRSSGREDTAPRLAAIRDGITALAREWGATTGAVEAGFVGSNARSALALGQARAAAVLGLHDAGLAVVEYAPVAVKQAVAGYGAGSKEQIAEMVRIQLGLVELSVPLDASDALAVAITHWLHQRAPA